MRLLVLTQAVNLDDPYMGFFHRWLEHFAARASGVRVAANGVGRYNLPPNVRVYSLGKERGASRILKSLRLALFLVRNLSSSDGVFVHMCPEYVWILYPINFFFRKPVAMWYAHVQVSKGAVWAVKHVDYILSPSTESFALPTGKLVTTGHGIDTDLFTPASRAQHDKTRIVSLSRISYVKDIDTLIEAIRVLVHDMNMHDIEVDIYGGPARPEDHEYLRGLKEKVKMYGLEPYIAWRGVATNRDAIDIYRGADVFVRMQPGGGYGKTELEAMSCGVPVVLCTPVYNAYLPDFSNDMYFEAGDAAGLARNIATVMGWDEDRRSRYATVARSLVREHHDLAQLADRIITTLRHTS